MHTLRFACGSGSQETKSLRLPLASTRRVRDRETAKEDDRYDIKEGSDDGFHTCTFWRSLGENNGQVGREASRRILLRFWKRTLRERRAWRSIHRFIHLYNFSALFILSSLAATVAGYPFRQKDRRCSNKIGLYSNREVIYRYLILILVLHRPPRPQLT